MLSVFLPMEQALLAETVRGSGDRTRIFAWYNVCATLTGAIGALLLEKCFPLLGETVLSTPLGQLKMRFTSVVDMFQTRLIFFNAERTHGDDLS